MGAGALGLAAAAAVLVLGLSLAHADSRVNRLTGALARAQRGVVASALATPGHRVVDLRAGSTRVASFVLVPDGRGYLMNASMAPLSAGRTYQLWAIVGGKPVSLGLMGRAPGPVVFTLADASGASALAVTIEPANGSSVPSSAPVAQGSISA